MDKRIEEYWVGKYPYLFAGYYKGIRRSPMAWGFTCANGWFDILNQLWIDLHEFEGLVLAQVKEKLGGLRVYPYPMNKDVRDEVHGLIGQAKTASYSTCEMCGESGKRRGGDWIFTLCDNCVKLEGNDKWTVSENIGNKIAKKLGLRTECKMVEDHILNHNCTSCIVCGLVRPKTTDVKGGIV